MHGLIRLDPGVKIVQHNSRVEAIRAIDSGEVFNSSTESTTHINNRWKNDTWTNSPSLQQTIEATVSAGIPIAAAAPCG